MSETETEHAVGSNSTQNFLQINNDDNYRDSLFGKTKQDEGKNSTSFFKKGSRPSMNDYQPDGMPAKVSLFEGLQQMKEAKERGGPIQSISPRQKNAYEPYNPLDPPKLAT